MLKNAIRLGDTTSHGGRVLTGNPRYIIFGKAVACVGDTVFCPLCKMPTVIVEGDSSWSVDGRNVAVAGCKTSCGAVLIPSQGNVFGDREGSSMTTTAAGSASTISAEITPIIGSETAGILKRYANAATGDNAFPEHLTAADEKGVGSKIRDIYGGNDTIQNQADIAAYNDKKSALGVTHGQIFNASEKAVGVLGIAEGGLALSKLGSAGKAAETIHPGLHNQANLIPDVSRDSFKTRRVVDMNKLSAEEKAAKNALKLQGRDEELIEQILSSGDNFETQTYKPGDKLFGFTSESYPKTGASPYWLDEVGYKDAQSKFFKDGAWDKEGLKGYLALPCYNSANALETTEVVQEQTVVKSTIGKATELLQYKSADGTSTGLMGKIMGGGGAQVSPDPKALGNISRIDKGL